MSLPWSTSSWFVRWLYMRAWAPVARRRPSGGTDQAPVAVASSRRHAREPPPLTEVTGRARRQHSHARLGAGDPAACCPGGQSGRVGGTAGIARRGGSGRGRTQVLTVGGGLRAGVVTKHGAGGGRGGRGCESARSTAAGRAAFRADAVAAATSPRGVRRWRARAVISSAGRGR